jgi:predicted ATPase
VIQLARVILPHTVGESYSILRVKRNVGLLTARLIAQTLTSIEDVALFTEMLSLANDGRYPERDLPPEQRRQRTLEALTSQIAKLARQNPVLMIFEDAHWVDATSLEVLGRAVDRIKTLPALLIVTFRAEFSAPWVGQSHVTRLMSECR